MVDTPHEFAFFLADIPKSTVGIITDRALVQRMVTVLRMNSGERCLLFTKNEWVRCSITSIESHKISVAIEERHRIESIQPTIDLVISPLDRAAFEEVVRIATVLGVRRITIMSSAKSGLKAKNIVSNESLKDRIGRIMIAAAEQSKQFALPEVVIGGALATSIFSVDHYSILFHPEGESIVDLQKLLMKQKNIVVYIGPSEGFTADEREFFKKNGVSPVALTPTILRSEDAVMVGIGLLRSVLRSRPL